jgi:hypothetical protein
VFVALDLQTLQDYPGLARVIIGGLLNALYHANGPSAWYTITSTMPYLRPASRATSSRLMLPSRAA